jgi:hypothetical protein
MENLELNPMLKQLLEITCTARYEENVQLDEEHLLMEYNLLLKEGRLNELFENETLHNANLIMVEESSLTNSKKESL